MTDKSGNLPSLDKEIKQIWGAVIVFLIGLALLVAGVLAGQGIFCAIGGGIMLLAGAGAGEDA